MSWGGHCTRWAVPALWLLTLPGLAASNEDPVVLDARRYDIVAGRFSKFEDFEARLQVKLDACGQGEPAVTPKGEPPAGRIGRPTMEAIKRLPACDGAAIPPDSLARQGVLTASVWKMVMGERPVPTPVDRAHALVLNFEGTDFGDPPEWNLCQDGVKQGPKGLTACYNSSDPCSYVTWGPRGATAGAGREIQYVLAAMNRQDPGLLKSAFGAEYPTLSRFFRVKSEAGETCSGPIPLKILVCSIWAKGDRRAAWERALAQLGREPSVRAAYEKLYAAEEFDGGKLRAFYAMWNALALPPSEVDFAFFLDRITHLGGPPEPSKAMTEKMQTCITGQSGAISRHGAARRCLSQLQSHATQQENRTARDVAYYLDAYVKDAIPEREVKLWAAYVPLSAVHNFGLRDDVAAPLPQSETLKALDLELPPALDGQVLPAEIARCPAIVLTPLPKP